MAVTIKELWGTGDGQLTRQSGVQLVRRFHIIPTGTADIASYGTPAKAITALTATHMGGNYNIIGTDGHTFSTSCVYEDPQGDLDTSLIPQTMSFGYVDRSRYITEVTVTYGPPSGGSFPNTIPRRRYSVGMRTIRTPVSLDINTNGIPESIGRSTFTHVYTGDPGDYTNYGVPAAGWEEQTDDDGNPLVKVDPDADIGKDILVPEVRFDIALPYGVTSIPGNIPAAVGGFLQWVGYVHSGGNWQGCLAGQIQYVGFEAEEIGPNSGDFEFMHHYRCGQNTIVDPGAAPPNNYRVLGLSEDFWWEWVEVSGARLPWALHVIHVYPEVDFNTIVWTP